MTTIDTDQDEQDAQAAARRALSGEQNDYRSAGYHPPEDAARAMLGSRSGHELSGPAYDRAVEIIAEQLDADEDAAQ